jgi:hypothetical protein
MDRQYLYHVTEKTKLPSIMEHGLLPMRGPRSSLCGEAKPAVYCFPGREDLEDAMMNWLGESFVEADIAEGGLVILEIDADGLLIESDAGYELAILEIIQPTRIINVFNEDWTPYKSSSTETELDINESTGLTVMS